MEIPMPAIPGRVIAVLSIDNTPCTVFWNEGIRRVVYCTGSHWYLGDDCNTIEALRDLTGRSLAVGSLNLYEYGIDITTHEDSSKFAECEWSDYASDNMCVRAVLSTAPNNRPRGDSANLF